MLNVRVNCFAEHYKVLLDVVILSLRRKCSKCHRPRRCGRERRPTDTKKQSMSTCIIIFENWDRSWLQCSRSSNRSAAFCLRRSRPANLGWRCTTWTTSDSMHQPLKYFNLVSLTKTNKKNESWELKTRQKQNKMLSRSIDSTQLAVPAGSSSYESLVEVWRHRSGYCGHWCCAPKKSPSFII